jgi:hypothetical protein
MLKEAREFGENRSARSKNRPLGREIRTQGWNLGLVVACARFENEFRQ